MLKKKYKILLKIIILIIILNFFLIYFGKKYLIRFDEFIYENNNIIIKNKLNNLIKNINGLDYHETLYSFTYNKDKEIVGANFNSNIINKYLSLYINEFENDLNDFLYNEYLYKYGKSFKTSNNSYLYVPLGIIYNNPFLYNIGPNIILSYNVINSFSFKIDMDVKNYGYNNILIMLYLNVTVDQSIIKPVLEKTNTTSYKFLLSSNIVYGRVSSILNNGFSLQSDII